MAAISNATTTTSITESINSEYIQRVVQDVQRAQPIAMNVGNVVIGSGTNASVYTIMKLDDLSVSLNEDSGKTQTDELAASEQTLTETQITAVTVGVRVGISDEASQDSILNLLETAIRNGSAKLKDIMDVDYFENSTGITLNSDFSGTDLTIDRFGAALAKYRNANPVGGRPVFVGHETQISDLRDSLRSAGGSQLLASAYGDQMTGAMMNMNRGYVGMFEGVEVWSTTNVVQADASNWTGVLMSGGMGGAMSLGIWKPITIELEREAKRLMTDVVLSVRYGTKLTNDGEAVRVLSSKT